MILIFYHVAILFLGSWIYSTFFRRKNDWLLSLVSIVTLGLIVSVPITYLLSVVFQNSSDPLWFGIATFSTAMYCLMWWKRKTIRFKINFSEKSSLPEVGVVLGTMVLSSYIMMKSFKVSSDGILLVARNVVFDFGHSVSILRSFSWGGNIPYSSPFVANTQHIYHFIFQYWSAQLEHFGVPIQWAVNIPGIVGFSVFLLVIYIFSKELFNNKVIGFISIIFTVFHGGMMFIPFFQKYGISVSSILRNPNYLFAGPFDGSIYSLFFTLNVFVNQRQLGISLAFFFLLYLFLLQEIDHKKLTLGKAFIFALCIGIFTLWHLVLSTGLLFTFVCTLLVHRKWKETFILISNTLFISLLFIHPWLSYLIRGAISFVTNNGDGVVTAVSEFSLLEWIISYVYSNFGITTLFFVLGILAYQKILKKIFPLFLLFGLFTAITIRTGIIDQKYLNIFLVMVAVFSSAGVIYLYTKNILLKAVTLMFFPFLILSGIIDFMVIKNDYLFPVEVTKQNRLTYWIKNNTPKTATFLSYEEIFDPVTLAGRYNYYGFYKQPNSFLEAGDKARSTLVKEMYEASEEGTLREQAKKANILFMAIPTNKTEEFTYKVNMKMLNDNFAKLYEDDNNIVFSLR